MKGKKRNNAVGLKGRSGRKTAREEAEKILNMELANQIGNQELLRLSKLAVKKRPHYKIKDVVMPIIIKGIAEKKEINLKVAELKKIQEDTKKLLNGRQIKKASGTKV